MRILERIESAWSAARAATQDGGAAEALDMALPRTAVVAMRCPASDVPQAQLMQADLLITGRLDVTGFRVPGVITEYLPPADGFPARHTEEEISAYLARRLSGLAVKWNLTRIIAVDSEAVALLRDWQAREPQEGREIVETVAPNAPPRQSVGQDTAAKAG